MPSTTPDFKIEIGIGASGATTALTAGSSSGLGACAIGSTGSADRAETVVWSTTAGAAFPRRLRLGQKESIFLTRAEAPLDGTFTSSRGPDRATPAPLA